MNLLPPPSHDALTLAVILSGIQAGYRLYPWIQRFRKGPFIFDVVAGGALWSYFLWWLLS